MAEEPESDQAIEQIKRLIVICNKRPRKLEECVICKHLSALSNRPILNEFFDYSLANFHF